MATITRSKVTRADLAHWDGTTKTTSRVDATGGTVTALTVGEAVDVLQVYGSGTDRTVGTINAATSRIGSANCTLLFATGTWAIDSNVTVPDNFSVRIPCGCVFDISTGITLTFAGPVFVEHPDWLTGDGSALTQQGAAGFPNY